MREKIKELIASHVGLDPADIEEQADLRDDLALQPSSLGDLLVAVKDNFGAEIPVEEIQEINTVEELIDLIESNVQEE